MNLSPSNTHKLKLDLDPRFECSICLEHLKNPVLTSCGHKFCASCIESWIQNKHKKYCPIDEVELKKEDIFPDNYTRREILENRLTCPYQQCSSKLSIPEYEAHVNKCYLKYSNHTNKDIPDFSSKLSTNFPCFPIPQKNSKKLTLTIFPTHLNMQVNSHEFFACKFYQVGCREVFKSNALLEKHYDLKTAFHLELLFNQYCSTGSSSSEKIEDKSKNSTTVNGDYKKMENHSLGELNNSGGSPSLYDSSDAHDENNESLNKSENLNSSDSNSSDAVNSPFTKNQKQIEAYLMKNKEQESKLWDPSKNENKGDTSDKSCSMCVDNSNLLKLLYERIVLLEQSKLELEIKVNKLESNLKQTVDIEDNVTLKLCNGTYYWKLDNFRSKLLEMTQTNRYFYSACFYSSCYGYR